MSLPEAFIKHTEALLGKEAADLFMALEKPAPVSIRFNPEKFSEKPILQNPEKLDGPVFWSSEGQYLKDRPAFTFDPLLHAGCYYVQEASSMFVEQALKRALLEMDGNALRMLDLCAAPGGKSTLLSSVLPKGSLLVANELIRTRANILAENLIKWGTPDIVVTQSDSSAFKALTGFFDLILTDVPCSGEGMFRKDPDAIAEWSEDNVKLCAARQREILTNCWPALRTGGFLIYSTCTYNIHEDEENVRWICEELGARFVEIPIEAEWKITGSLAPFSKTEQPVYRFLPHKTRGEGFFLTLLQKTEESGQECSVWSRKSKALKKESGQNKQPEISAKVRDFLKSPAFYDFSLNRQGQIYAFPKEHKQALRLLEEKLRIVHAGIVLGEMKGKDLLPDISLALSTELNLDKIPVCRLDLKQAIDYLRREAFALPETCPLGWVLMLYEGHPLGWMKNIGNRANNAYPNEWRIRSANPY